MSNLDHPIRRMLAALGRCSATVVVAAVVLCVWGGVCDVPAAASIGDDPCSSSQADAEGCDDGEHEGPCEDCDDGGCEDADCMGALHSCGCCPNVVGATSHAPVLPNYSDNDLRCACSDDLEVREGVRARIDRPPRA